MIGWSVKYGKDILLWRVGTFRWLKIKLKIDHIIEIWSSWLYWKGLGTLSESSWIFRQNCCKLTTISVYVSCLCFEWFWIFYPFWFGWRCYLVGRYFVIYFSKSFAPTKASRKKNHTTKQKNSFKSKQSPKYFQKE